MKLTSDKIDTFAQNRYDEISEKVDEISEKVLAYIKQEFIDWQSRNPKRKIELWEGNGVTLLEIDDMALSDWEIQLEQLARFNPFKQLLDALEVAQDMSTNYGNQYENCFITIEDSYCLDAIDGKQYQLNLVKKLP